MRQLRTVAVLATAALVLAGCGGAGGPAGGSGDGAGATAGEPAATAGFDGTTIRLGVLTPLSGPVAVIGNPVTSGNQVWFDRVNAEGGIAGKYQVELVQEDTQYAPDVTVQQYNKIKNDVVGFAQVLGTAPVLAILPLLEADGGTAGAATLDAFWVREPNLLPVGAPYQIQSINALDHYLSSGGTSADPICAMAQDDAYGDAGLAGLEFAAEQRGIALANVQRYRLGATDVTGNIGALAAAGCKMVLLTATPSDAGRVWGTAAQANFPGIWYGQSPSWIGALAQTPFAPYLQSNVRILAEGTEWGDTSVPGMQQMLDDVAAYAPDQQPDYYFAFGYYQGRAMEALLEKAVELGDLSKPGLLAANEQLGTVTFDGLAGDYQYGPVADRNPPRTTTVFQVDPAKPFGLGVLVRDVSAPEAEAFEFVEADL
jgi:ABC-type branched-subunit amino acid transport system substrate-binding protein